MLDGKKGVAQKIVYGAFERVADKTGKEAVEIFEEAMNNIMPVLEVKAKRIGGATYQVPIEVKPERRQALALRWLTAYSRKRGEKTQEERLANEIMDAANNTGGYIRGDLHGLVSNSVNLISYWLDDGNGVSAVTQQQLVNGQKDMVRGYQDAMKYIELESKDFSRFQSTIDKNNKELNKLTDKQAFIPQTEDDFRALAEMNLLKNKAFEKVAKDDPKRFQKFVDIETKVVKSKYSKGTLEADQLAINRLKAENKDLKQTGDIGAIINNSMINAPKVVASYFAQKSKIAMGNYRDLVQARLYNVAEKDSKAASFYATVAEQAAAVGVQKDTYLNYKLAIDAQKAAYSEMGDQLVDNLLSSFTLRGLLYSNDYSNGSNGLNYWGTARTNTPLGSISAAIRGVSSNTAVQMCVAVSSAQAYANMTAIEQLYKMEGFNEKGMSLQDVLNPTKQTLTYIERKIAENAEGYKSQTAQRSTYKAQLDKWVSYRVLANIGAAAQKDLQAAVLASIGNNEQASKASTQLWKNLANNLLQLDGGAYYNFRSNGR